MSAEKIRMRDGDAILVMMKDGAWVGTVSKLDGQIMAITSKHFFGYQMPASKEVDAAIRERFE